MVSPRVLVRELRRDYAPELTLSETREMVARSREAIAQSRARISDTRELVSHSNRVVAQSREPMAKIDTILRRPGPFA
jgi:hypothetical protein